MTSLRNFHRARKSLMERGEPMLLNGEQQLEVPAIVFQTMNHPTDMCLIMPILLMAIKTCPKYNFLLRVTHSEGYQVCFIYEDVDRIIGKWFNLKKYFTLPPGYHICSWFWLQAIPLFFPNNRQTKQVMFHNPHLASRCQCGSCGYGEDPSHLTLAIPYTEYHHAHSLPVLQYRTVFTNFSGPSFWTMGADFPFLFIQQIGLLTGKGGILDFELCVNGKVMSLNNSLLSTKSPDIWLMLLDDSLQTESDCAASLRRFVEQPQSFDFCAVRNLECVIESRFTLAITVLDLTNYHLSEDFEMSYTNFPFAPDLSEIEDLLQ